MDAVGVETGLLLWRYRARRRVRDGEERMTRDTDDAWTGDNGLEGEGCWETPEREGTGTSNGLKQGHKHIVQHMHPNDYTVKVDRSYI